MEETMEEQVNDRIAKLEADDWREFREACPCRHKDLEDYVYWCSIQRYKEGGNLMDVLCCKPCPLYRAAKWGQR